MDYNQKTGLCFEASGCIQRLLDDPWELRVNLIPEQLKQWLPCFLTEILIKITAASPAIVLVSNRKSRKENKKPAVVYGRRVYRRRMLQPIRCVALSSAERLALNR